MKCAYCDYTDGLVYTSMPPKYRCTITNEFHLGFDDCDVEFTPVRHGKWESVQYGCVCSVCGKRKEQFSDNFCANCGAKMDGE